MYAYVYVGVYVYIFGKQAQGKEGRTPRLGLTVDWVRVLNPCLTARLLPALLFALSLCLDPQYHSHVLLALHG